MSPDFHSQVEEVFADWRYDHPKTLYGLIRSLHPQVVVEVGTYRGYAAAWMARALQENGASRTGGPSGRLYCIDNFSLVDHVGRYGDARAHLESNFDRLGVRDVITILEGDSNKVAWPERVDFAYIDGWHGYLAVKHDFSKAAELGAECICLDDTAHAVGPRLLVERARELESIDDVNWDVVEVLSDCGLAIFMRRKAKGPVPFSQELPGHPGVDLRTLTAEERAKHFAAAKEATGVDYTAVHLGSEYEGE